MAVSLTKSRSMFAASLVLVVAVGIVVALGVIPPVRVATAPDITPESAVPAFWVGVGLHALSALILVLTIVLTKARSRFSTIYLVVTGLLVLLLGFVLADAASAFGAADMGGVAALLFGCVAADALAGALIIAAALLLPRRMLSA